MNSRYVAHLGHGILLIVSAALVYGAAERGRLSWTILSCALFLWQLVIYNDSLRQETLREGKRGNDDEQRTNT